MKIEIDVPDAVVPFWQAEAQALGVSLGQMILMKAAQQSHIVKGDFDVAPPPEGYVPPSPTCACPHCLLRCPNPPRQNSPAQCGECFTKHPEPGL